jgi:transcriptional regulator with XRE-family HTH domain
MVTAKECEKAAQEFLDTLMGMLNHLPREYPSQTALAKAAGVSDPTISDYKNGNKMEKPEFRKVFQVAYALMGRTPCSLKQETEDINFRKIRNALKSDMGSLILRLSEIILNSPPSHQALQFIKSAIDTAHTQATSLPKKQDRSA